VKVYLDTSALLAVLDNGFLQAAKIVPGGANAYTLNNPATIGFKMM